jgi:galactose mutarotase-like enzyme
VKTGQTRVVERRGWTVVQLDSELLRAEVLPGKGGDVLSLRWVPAGTELLWQSPWGVRERGAAPLGADSVTRLMAAYPGGWQTVFPNGGDPVIEHGVEWGMHGEVWLAPFDWEVSGSTVEMSARLVQSPFSVRKRVALEGARLSVTEQITHQGGSPVDVMWSQHPALGAPLLSERATVTTNARLVHADDSRDTPSQDLLRGAGGAWPACPGPRGMTDLSRLPARDTGVDRMAYLSDFAGDPWARLSNPEAGLEATLSWDGGSFPYAWYWLEAGGTAGFPWYNAAYVFAIEPASSYPGQGLHAARRKTATHLRMLPGETRTAWVTLSVGPLE